MRDGHGQNSAPITKACARPLGTGCSAYSRARPHCLPVPSRCLNAAWSCGVVMIGKSPGCRQASTPTAGSKSWAYRRRAAVCLEVTSVSGWSRVPAPPARNDLLTRHGWSAAKPLPERKPSYRRSRSRSLPENPKVRANNAAIQSGIGGALRRYRVVSAIDRDDRWITACERSLKRDHSTGETVAAGHSLRREMVGAPDIAAQ